MPPVLEPNPVRLELEQSPASSLPPPVTDRAATVLPVRIEALTIAAASAPLTSTPVPLPVRDDADWMVTPTVEALVLRAESMTETADPVEPLTVRPQRMYALEAALPQEVE